MHATITGPRESYGYLFLFVLVGLESLGVPLPGETALVTAAAYAALGHLNVYIVIVTAAAAAVLGDNDGYWIGRRGGLAVGDSSRCPSPILIERSTTSTPRPIQISQCERYDSLRAHITDSAEAGFVSYLYSATF